MNDRDIGYDWRAEPPIRRRPEDQPLTVTMRIEVHIYGTGDAEDEAEDAAKRLKVALQEQAGILCMYGVSVEVTNVE